MSEFDEEYRDRKVSEFLNISISRDHEAKWYKVPMVWYLAIIIVGVPLALIVLAIAGI